MRRTILTTVALVAGLLVSLAADSAQAQGCCKAGLCRIPSIPSGGSSASNSFAQLQADVAGQLQAASASPAARPEAGAVTQITLSNPLDSRETIEYNLDGKSYTLEPGMSLTLNSPSARKIEFIRGKTAGSAKYRVSRGSYEFARTDKGWELYRLAAN